MRKMMMALVAVVSALAVAGQSQAQVRVSRFHAVGGVYGRPAYISPYLGTPYVNSAAALGPYGYSRTVVVGTTARPFYAGPFHSIYFDAFANRYVYGTGYLNTPTYSSFYLGNPYLYGNPYLTNPYLYGNPYPANPYLPY